MIEDNIPGEEIAISGRDFILYVRDFLLSWDGRIEFFKLKNPKLTIINARNGDIKDQFNRFSKTQKTAILNAVNGALNDIKKIAGNDPETMDPNDLNTLIKSHMKVGLAKWDGVSQSEMLQAYRELCELDAIFDLLSGELYRFDPVIGDLGCQWRVPFILDLYDTMHEQAVVQCGDVQSLQNILANYQNARGGLPSCVEILTVCQKSEMATVQKGKQPSYKSKKIRPIYDMITTFCKDIANIMPDYASLVAHINAEIKLWKVEEIPGFNPYDYFVACKILTTNRVRTFDEFGLSGVPTTLDIPDAKKSLNKMVLDIANNSMRYMTYLATEVCLNCGLEIDDDGYARYEDGRPNIHIAGSSLKLMKDARFWTFQNSSCFLTKVCYGPLRSIFAYQSTRGQPIIIDVRRLMCSQDDTVEGGYRYTYNGGAVLYFEPDNNGVFRYIPNPSEEQANKVGMICEAYSMVLDGQPLPFNDDDLVLASPNFDDYLTAITTTHSIIDLILSGIVTHPELPSQIFIEDKSQILLEEVVDELAFEKYIEATGRTNRPALPDAPWILCNNPVPFPNGSTPEWDLLIEKEMFWSVIRKFGIETAQYKKPLPGDRTQAERNVGTVPFGPIHIFGGTYQRKKFELDQIEQNLDYNIQGIRRVRDEDCRRRPE